MAHPCECKDGDRGWSPLNSIIQVNSDNSITITPPAEYIYVGFELGGNKLIRMNGPAITTVSCKCNATGSCLPFTSPKGNGCIGNCTDCTMKQSARIAEKTIQFDSGDYINIAEGVHFVDKHIEIPAAFEAMFQITEVKKGIREFIDSVYQGLPVPLLIEGKGFVAAPEGYSMAILNIFGRAAAIIVPNIVIESRMAVGSKINCSCTDGECVPGDWAGGAVKTCLGNCKGTCLKYFYNFA